MSVGSGKARAEQVTREMDIVVGKSWRRVVTDAKTFESRRSGTMAGFAILRPDGTRSDINIPATRIVRVRPTQLPDDSATPDAQSR